MPNSAEAGMNQVRARAKYLYKDRQECRAQREDQNQTTYIESPLT